MSKLSLGVQRAATKVLTGSSRMDYAATANAEHTLARQAGELMLEHAILAGRALISAKAEVKHGEWLSWLEAHFDGSESIAQRYMQVASNPARVRDLEEPSLRKALEAVSASNGRLAPLMTSETGEWYTPLEVVKKVVSVLGAIDLDPCSNPGEPRVPAARHYTAAEDGLGQLWSGRVYMNPPYGREIGAWVDKLADEYEAGNVTEAIALVPARTDTSWWAHLPASTVCFVTGRLTFSDHPNPAPFPSVAAYLGKDDRRFAEEFLPLGLVYVRLETDAAA